MSQNPFDQPDLPLLDGENPDLLQEARDVLGEDWLSQPNTRLMGRTPEQVIQSNQGARVRDIIRSIKHIGMS